MNDKDSNKTLLIVILAIVAVCGCMASSCCAVTFLVLSRMDRNKISSIVTENSFEEAEIEIPETESTEENTEAELITDDNGLTPEELQIIKSTEEKRGIEAEEKMAPVYKTQEELRQYLMDQLSEVTDEELADELGLYSILAFAPADFDLRQFYIDMYTEQIAGFYDPDENEMFLIEDISPYENALTLAHEYTHYLQYNNPEFDETLNYEDEFCENNGETCLIIDAIVEGDATLTENLIDAEETILKGQNKPSDDSASSSNVYEQAPKFFQDSLIFPYVYGFDFVLHYYLVGGFDEVNKLYTELPQSVEQIMHPEKYLKDAPIDVTLEPFRSMISKDFEIVKEDVMNESDIMMLLGSAYNEEWQLSERQASAGADGWGGGSYIFARNEGKPLFFTKIVWDSEKEAEEAETTFELYSDKRFGEQTSENQWSDENGNSVYLIRQDDILFWMILPDSFEADSFVDLIRYGSGL